MLTTRTPGLAALLVCLLAGSGPAPAGPFVACGVAPRPDCVMPHAGVGVPRPEAVRGKEYSHHGDRAGFPGHAPDPERSVAWDGLGGSADALDYSATRAGDASEREVDALSNVDDSLYSSVIANEAALLFSTDRDPVVYVETVAGAGSIWAVPSTVDEVAPRDVDGLEIWGRSGPQGDANRYSLEGDPDTDGAGPRPRVSVWSSIGSVSLPRFTASAIADAIGRPDLGDRIDLDAMMSAGSSLLFSIDPIDGFDGGEIWLWDGKTPAGADFLSHGGHRWDTAFCVMCTFGAASENVNAVEAAGVPEPATWALLATAIALVGFGRARGQHCVV